MRHPDRELWVYAIGWSESGPLKIGYSQNPNQRLYGMKGAVPSPMSEEMTVIETWPGGRELEHQIHLKLADKRQRRGGEWFNVSLAEVRTALEEIQGGPPVD